MVDVSHIVSVYTKRDYLPDTIASLIHQDTQLSREFIFVDDCSKDDSVEVIRQLTQGMPNVTIVTNSDNKGPSVRLNQGAKLANGAYLHFLDHDDVVPQNAIQVMHDMLSKYHGDFIYGTWKKTGKPGKELLSWRIDDPDVCFTHKDPLHSILTGRYKRMCTLVERNLFIKAGGFDERIFIQDESLPVRLAIKAARFISTPAIVNLVPIEIGNLSQNKSQLNHDRFLAYYYALADNPDCAESYRRLMYRRAISAGWKQTRGTHTLSWLTPMFGRYLYTFWLNDAVKASVLDSLFHQFSTLQNVRHP
ncbi:MAG: glycosyltransferase family 2 protein [Alphaproteobacteria bacterium]|nr:glycosyltransferase family 2 protein [Alphaproteobacteria bacterium]